MQLFLIQLLALVAWSAVGFCHETKPESIQNVSRNGILQIVMNNVLYIPGVSH